AARESERVASARLRQAITYAENALETAQLAYNSFAGEHLRPEMPRFMMRVGGSWENLEDYYHASTCYQMAAQFASDIHGNDNWRVAAARIHQARCYKKLGLRSRAIPLLADARSMLLQFKNQPNLSEEEKAIVRRLLNLCSYLSSGLATMQPDDNRTLKTLEEYQRLSEFAKKNLEAHSQKTHAEQPNDWVVAGGNVTYRLKPDDLSVETNRFGIDIRELPP